MKERGVGEELPWDRFFGWVKCVCVVTFDLELGQAMEVSYSIRFPFTLPPKK